MTEPSDTTPTIPVLVARALDAYADLLALGEDIEDEWSYVNDLETAWRDELETVAALRDGEPASSAQVGAVDRAVEEIAAITDPHRAIDWLSTFPQVVLLAIGGRP
jgi:hypothetical protein